MTRESSMNMKSAQAKENIIRVTSQLINDEPEIQNISIRRIARLAGVSAGSINYHFQTKDNLIRESVRIRANRVTARWLELNELLDVGPETRLRVLIKNTGEFFARHSNVMKLSTYNSLFTYHEEDTLSYYHYHVMLPLYKEIAPQKSEEQLKLTIATVAHSFYVTFLRCIYYPKYSVFDFFDREQREKYLDQFVDNMLLVLKS